MGPMIAHLWEKIHSHRQLWANKNPPAKPGVFHMRAKPYVTSKRVSSRKYGLTAAKVLLLAARNFPFKYPIKLDTDTFGANTIWYLQFHFVCDRLFMSFTMDDLPLLNWCSCQTAPLFYSKGSFLVFIIAIRLLLNHSPREWFSFCK